MSGPSLGAMDCPSALQHPFHPTSASWLNLVERFFSTLCEKWIKRQVNVSVKDLESSIEYYLETYNQNPKPFRWHKKAENTLGSVARAAKALGT